MSPRKIVLYILPFSPLSERCISRRFYVPPLGFASRTFFVIGDSVELPKQLDLGYARRFHFGQFFGTFQCRKITHECYQSMLKQTWGGGGANHLCVSFTLPDILPLGCAWHTFCSLPRSVLHIPFGTFLHIPSECISCTFLSPPLEVCFTYLFVPSPRGVFHVPFCPLPSGCASGWTWYHICSSRLTSLVSDA